MEIKRDSYLEQLKIRKDNGMIKIITGIRRCGKSFLLFVLFKKYLLESGVDNDHIIEIALDGIENEELREPKKCYQHIKDVMKDDQKYYLLLDEVQFMPRFEEVLNSLLRISNIDVYVTGSNSKFLHFGITTCRLFKILKNKQGLKESKVISYDISNPKDRDYLSGTIFFSRLLRMLGFLIFFVMKRSLDDVSAYLAKHAIPEKWNTVQIEDIKKFIKDRIGKDLSKVKAKRVVIIKNELDFMSEMGYPLKTEDGCECLSIDEYKEAVSTTFELEHAHRRSKKIVFIQDNEIACDFGYRIGIPKMPCEIGIL